MVSTLHLYRFCTVLLILVCGQIVFASSPNAKGTSFDFPSSNSIENISIAPSDNPKTKDSLATIGQSNLEYLETRYFDLASLVSKRDTIRVPSKNNDPLQEDNLSTLKSKGENNFITRNLFSLIIKDNQPDKGQMAVNSTLYFAPFAGMRIGKIRIQQLDVFGPTLQDTLRQPSSWIGRTGNIIHLKTTEKKLRYQLLFNSGESVDPQLMADNEKIIRDLPYIQDVAITLSKSDNNANEADVLVIIKERFEYAISGSGSTNSTELRIIDENMFGIGHQFLTSMEFNKNENPKWGGRVNYEISDLGGKFIKTGLGYTNTFGKTGWNAYIDKQFIASKVDWAGGVDLERAYSDYYLTPYSYARLDTAASYFNSDIWYGRLIKSQNYYSTFGNIMLAGRYLHQNFYNLLASKPANSYLRNHDFIIGSLGISKRYLFKNNQVYGYGITEDIPYGQFAELAMGFDIGNNQTRPYLHFRYAKAKILNGGAYFKWQAAIGGFMNHTRPEQGVFLLSTNYFTNFVYINKHPYRFFINFELLNGIHRFEEEFLGINRSYGIRDYFSLDTKGTNRLKINIESVRFWGWNKSGFRFANYFFADAAFLSNSVRTVLTDKFFGGIGFGFRVHNESLVLNTLEIRLSWIPIAPKGYSPFVFNAFEQPKARFNDFLGGKPQEITYK